MNNKINKKHLNNKLKEYKKKLFHLRIEKVVGKLDDCSEVKFMKKCISKIITFIINDKKIIKG